MMEFTVQTESGRVETLFADRYNLDEYGLHFYCRARKVKQFDEGAEIIEAETFDDDGPLQPRGRVQFNTLADVEFKDLVLETLEQSEYIEVADGIIYEVMDEE